MVHLAGTKGRIPRIIWRSRPAEQKSTTPQGLGPHVPSAMRVNKREKQITICYRQETIDGQSSKKAIETAV